MTGTIGTRPDAGLVSTMLDNATLLLKLDEKPIVHSDRGDTIVVLVGLREWRKPG